jgi:F-type H+-transporting ATPase subunit a
MTALEVLIQFLQAYIFTLLASIYIQGALEEGH